MRSSYRLSHGVALLGVGFAAFAWGRIHEQGVLDEEKRAVIVLQEVLTNGVDAMEEIQRREDEREHSIVVTPLKAI